MGIEVAIQLVVGALVIWMMFWLKDIRTSISNLWSKYDGLNNRLFHEITEVRDRLGNIEGRMDADK